MILSIAMTTRNGARYLQDQLESIARQTRQPDELIVSDDASSDDTVGIVSRFQSQSGFEVVLLRASTREGQPAALARALSRCTGDWLFIADQDDVWLPSKLAAYEAALRNRSEAVLVASDSIMVGPGLESLGRTYWQQARFASRRWHHVGGESSFSNVLRFAPLLGHGLALKKQMVARVLPFPAELTYDDWIPLVCSAFGEVVLVEKPQTLYRQHPGQQSGPAPQTLREKALGASREASLFAFEHQLRGLARIEERLLEVAPDRRRHWARALDRKRRYLEARLRMRSSASSWRLAGVLRNIVTRAYWTAGRGWLALARDLLSP